MAAFSQYKGTVRAIHELRRGNFERALEISQNSLETDDQDFWAAFTACTSAGYLNDRQEFVRYLYKMEQLQEDSPYLAYLQAYLALWMSDSEKALWYWTRLLEIPEGWLARELLAKSKTSAHFLQRAKLDSISNFILLPDFFDDVDSFYELSSQSYGKGKIIDFQQGAAWPSATEKEKKSSSSAWISALPKEPEQDPQEKHKQESTLKNPALSETVIDAADDKPDEKTFSAQKNRLIAEDAASEDESDNAVLPTKSAFHESDNSGDNKNVIASENTQNVVEPVQKKNIFWAGHWGGWKKLRESLNNSQSVSHPSQNKQRQKGQKTTPKSSRPLSLAHYFTVAVLAVVSASAFYYFVFFLPQRSRNQKISQQWQNTQKLQIEEWANILYKGKDVLYVYNDREQLIADFNRAKKIIRDGKINQARYLLQRILLSNADFKTKEKSRLFLGFIPDVAYENFHDPVTLKNISKEPQFYLDVLLLQEGKILSEQDVENGKIFSALVTEDDKEYLIDTFFPLKQEEKNWLPYEEFQKKQKDSGEKMAIFYGKFKGFSGTPKKIYIELKKMWY